MTPLPTPDLKPHVPPQPPGSECCDCCEGIAAETPQGIANREGLSAIAYRIGDYAQFRDSLRAALSSSKPELAALQALRTRDDDDFTIGLVDAFACAADVLTFYQERIANESYLRTALERVSLQEMGKLIGYRLRPGVAAETWLAFALDTPPTPPVRLAPEPGAFVTGVPASVTLDAGLKVQSVPGPNEKPQTFETAEAIDARPAWNAMRPWMTQPVTPVRDHTQTYVAGVRNNLKAGDALIFVGDEFDGDASRTSNRWDFRILDSVTPDADNDRTQLTWTRGLGSGTAPVDPPAQPRLYALRKRGAVFGHNAPMWLSMSADFHTNYPNSKDDKGTLLLDWPRFVLSPAGDGHVDLDAVVAEAVPGASGRYAVLAKGKFNYPAQPAGESTYVELYAIDSAAEVSRAEFALSGKVTRLAVRGANYGLFKDYVRETVVFVQSEKLEPAEYPVIDDVGGAHVPVAASADGLLPGRRLIVRGTRKSDGAAVAVQATLVAAHAIDAAHCELEIKPTLPALKRDSVVVHANVALASHGETVAQVLGAGNASQAFQRFELKQTPLTYRAADNEVGAAADLTVRVGDILWHERATMFGAAPTEHAYTLASDEQGRTLVVFGDGARGARLPSGPNNVRASYRKGLGAAGNVAANKLTQLMSRPLGLKGVSNPRAAEGGTDAEDAQAARQSMPLETRTLGRAVSVLDYEDFARAFSGIAKAQARVLQLPHGAIVAITIAGTRGAALTIDSTVWSHLLDALKDSGDPLVSVRLLSASLVTFKLGLKVKPDPDYETKTVLAAVEAALRGAFSFDARDLAGPVQRSEVVAVAQAVPGVVAVAITRLYRDATPTKEMRLLAAAMRVQSGVALPAELLTLDAGPLDQLEVMS